MFDHLLESSLRDDSNKWSNKGFKEEIGTLKFEMCSLSGVLERFKISMLSLYPMTIDNLCKLFGSRGGPTKHVKNLYLDRKLY